MYQFPTSNEYASSRPGSIQNDGTKAPTATNNSSTAKYSGQILSIRLTKNDLTCTVEVFAYSRRKSSVIRNELSRKNMQTPKFPASLIARRNCQNCAECPEELEVGPDGKLWQTNTAKNARNRKRSSSGL